MGEREGDMSGFRAHRCTAGENTNALSVKCCASNHDRILNVHVHFG